MTKSLFIIVVLTGVVLQVATTVATANNEATTVYNNDTTIKSNDTTVINNDTTINSNDTTVISTVNYDVTTVGGGESTTINPAFLQPGDPRRCPGDNSKILRALPGYGWDNLVATVRKPIFNYNYSHCLRMEDNALLPNGVNGYPVNEESTDAVVFAKFDDYYPVGAKNMVRLTEIGGKFADDYSRVKKGLVADRSITVRVVKSKKLYQVQLKAGLDLDQDFADAILKVADAVAGGNRSVVEYYAESVVAEYGTHFIDSNTVGGQIVMEDRVREPFFDVNEALDEARFERTAQTVFAVELNLTSMTDLERDDKKLFDAVKVYLQSRNKHSLTIKGGHEVFENYAEWSNNFADSPTTIERTGKSIVELIDTEHFTNIPPALVDSVRNEVQRAVQRYVIWNTHRGCTDRTAPNFESTANLNDINSCQSPVTNFTFGGLYQTCNQTSDEFGPLCEGLKQKNPLTNDFSCPQGYEATPLHFKADDKLYKTVKCERDCDVEILCPKICKDKYIFVTVEYRTYWCAATKNVPQDSGYLFGGIYTSRSTNPVTGSQRCPVNFGSIGMSEHVRVCVAEAGMSAAIPYGIPFAGFFSCVTGNPLAVPPNQAGVSEWPKSCPTGYSRRIATVDGTCPIYYCMSSSENNETMSLPLVQLPFAERPDASMMADVFNSSVAFMDHLNNAIWFRKNATGEWTKATTKEELEENGLDGLWSLIEPYYNNATTTTGDYGNSTRGGNSTMPSTVTLEPEHSSTAGMSGGTIAAIAIVTTLALIALLGLAAFVYKRRNSNPERQKLVNESEPSERDDTRPEREDTRTEREDSRTERDEAAIDSRTSSVHSTGDSPA